MHPSKVERSLFSEPPAYTLLPRPAGTGYLVCWFHGYSLQNPPPAEIVHTHNYGLNFVLAGKGELRTASGARYDLTPGICFQLPPESVNRLCIQHDSNYRECALALDPVTAKHLIATGVIELESVVAQVGMNETLLERFDAVRQAIQSSEPPTVALFRLIGVLSCLRELVQRTPAANAFLPAAQKLLDEDLQATLSIGDIARKLAMPEYTFRRAFQKATGVTPVQYRTRARIHHACVLLAGSPVYAVAHRLGYSDPFAFSRQFKHVMGISPAFFKNNIAHAEESGEP